MVTIAAHESEPPDERLAVGLSMEALAGSRAALAIVTTHVDLSCGSLRN